MNSRTTIRSLIVGATLMSLLGLTGAASAAVPAATWNRLDTKTPDGAYLGHTVYHADTRGPCLKGTVGKYIGSRGVSTSGCMAMVQRKVHLLGRCNLVGGRYERKHTVVTADLVHPAVVEFSTGGTGISSRESWRNNKTTTWNTVHMLYTYRSC